MVKLEEEIRRLGNQRGVRRTGASITAERGLAPSCNTCTRPTHGKVACPGKKVICYGCRLTGHFRGSKACKAKLAKNRVQTQMR